MKIGSPSGSIALAIVLGAVAMVGVSLDTAWHRTLGRDPLFILPHLMMYAVLIGLWVAVLAVIARTSLVRDADVGGPVVEGFGMRVPIGFLIIAFGLLVVTAAVPVDLLWHAVFGKDVRIWRPPNVLMHLGAVITAIGFLVATAAERDRGLFAQPRLWNSAMTLIFVDLVQRGHFLMAHYTMAPQTRTPDLYPLLAALFFPFVLVAALRTLRSWGPVDVTLTFLVVAFLIDVLLLVFRFERYTLTPILALPALGISLIGQRTRRRHNVRYAMIAGAVFTSVFIAIEAWWMAKVIEQPWSVRGLVFGAAVAIPAGALSGYVGWVLGGFLRSVDRSGGVVQNFGSIERARFAAAAALVLAVLGLVATYRPQRFGTPMRVPEFGLRRTEAVRVQDAMFWTALVDGERRRSRSAAEAARSVRSEEVEAESERIIDGSALPIGPAVCASNERLLARKLDRARFALEVNGAPVDLSLYPIVQLFDRTVGFCGWVGVAATFQRASVNRFVYTVEIGGDAAERTVTQLKVVFKDP